MSELLWIAELSLFASALALLVFVGLLMNGGSPGLLGELTFPIYFLSVFLFAMTGVAHGEFILPRHVRLPTLAGVNVLLLAALGLQLRAAKKSSDGGPTHPKNEEYDGGGQAYPWEEDE